MFNTRLVTSVVLLSALSLIGGTAQAAVITEFTGGNETAGLAFFGQSATTPAGGPWNTLTFNFFSDVSGGTTPSAAGTLFLLSTAYAGAPEDLSAATPGFIAQSQSIVGNVYLFDPSVTILGNTQYFFYTNAEVLVSGETTPDLYPGGNGFLVDVDGNYTSLEWLEAHFRLSGTPAPVPEPATLVLASSAALFLLVSRRPRR